ncbi:hypothetical protein BX666DRAFT_249130 [Dichotomocladium elegans]|nr:hypothetical protein BX666DRAFT_249130 [Dichotomocladium elegans]
MFLAVISMLVGAIHLILLFTLYRVNLVRSCVDDHMLGQFWWSLGFDRDDEIERAIVQCGKAWSRLSLQRAVVWGIYGFTLMTMVVLVYRHYRHLDNQWRLRIGDGDNDDSFDHETLTDHRLAPDEKMPVAQHEDCEKPKQDDFGTIQYQRRQRLYDEIQNQRTHGGRRQSRQQSQIPIHPLDPPPLGSAAQRAAEKMDYDFYREHLKHHIRQSPSPMDQDLSTDGATSRRRPTSWTVRNEYHHPPAAPQCAMQEDEDDEEIYRPPSPPGPLRGEEQDTGDEKRNMAEKD